MTSEELFKIEKLAEEFLSTLDDNQTVKWWTTEYQLGDQFVGDFLFWLGQKVGKESGWPADAEMSEEVR